MKVNLRHRITVQTQSSVTDAYGQKTDAWTDLVSRIAADVRTVSAREKMRGMAMESTLAMTVCVRYQKSLDAPGLLDGARIVYHGLHDRVFNVIGVKNINEDSRWLIFDCAESSRDGL